MKGLRKALPTFRTLWPWVMVATVAGLWACSRFCGGLAFGLRAGESLGGFLVEMALVLPPMFLLIGLFDVWVPREFVERHAGRCAGASAVPWMVLLATVQAGPLYAAFPVAVSLWRKGCAPQNVFIYLGAFSAMKIPMLTFEVAFLGWRFSLARTLVTLPVFIVIGVVLARLLPADFEPPGADSGPGAPGGSRCREPAPVCRSEPQPGNSAGG
jgi:uncharacterized membrane protein YraQ (UPF0718 family)